MLEAIRKLQILVLVGCVGCASSHHKHPHDHGLSSVKGHQKQLNRDTSRLAGYLRVQQMELSVHKGTIRQLESSLAQQIDVLKRTAEKLIVVDFEIVHQAANQAANQRNSIEQLKTHIDNVTSNHYTHTSRADRNIKTNQTLIKTLGATIASLERRLAKVEPPEPQKLLELLKEPEAEKPWDGKQLEENGKKE